MKKKIAGIIAMLMVLLVGTTVIAAPSVDKNSADKEILKAEKGSVTGATAKTPDGNAVAIEIQEVASTAIVESAKTHAEAAVKQVSENATAEVLGIIEVLAGIPEGYDSIDVTFQVAGIKMGDSIMVLHQKVDGNWEILNSRVLKDGEVIATFTSFSPVAIVKVTESNINVENNINIDVENSNNTDGAANNNTVVKKNETQTSPMTGDFVPVVVLLAVLCGAGIVFLGRKVIAK